MPKYTLRLGSAEIPLGETDKPIGEKLLEGAEPQTWIDGGGTIDKNRWNEQEYTRDQLLEYKKIRESGGPVASLIEAKALLNFGVGCEFQTGDEELDEWLNEEAFPNRDLTFIQIGKDGFTYPYAVAEAVETRGGDFSHVEFIEPWTMIPKTDGKGEIVAWEQQVKVNGSTKSKPVQPDEVAHFVLNRSSGRDKTGVSLIEQNKTEIERFYDNQESIKNSSQLHGFPQRHIKVGQEGGSAIDDNELRRVRQRFTGKINEMTAWFTGRDVQVDTLEASNFEYEGLTENDLKILTLSFLLPQELANVGSDGLGSGMPAELRKELLLIGVQAKQREVSRQFINQLVIPVVEKYSPFDPEEHNITLEWDEPLEDKSDRIEDVNKISDYLTTNEIREEAGYAPVDGPEGDEFSPPGKEQEEESEDGFGGLFASEGESDAPIVTFQNVGGDPFEDQESMEGFLQELDEASDGQVYIGKFPWPDADNPPIHDRPISAVGVTEDKANRIYESHKEDAVAIGGPKKVDDPISIFMGEAGSGNAKLADGEHFDDVYLRLWDRVVDTDETDKQLLVSDTQVPEFVKANIRDAILGGSIFSDFETIPSSELMQLREYMLESLQDDGWTIDGVADQLMQLPGVDTRDRAELIARTETAATLNSARENAYEEMGEGDERFYWTGSLDDRVTAACEWLIKETNPNHGGTPVEMKELKDLIAEAPEHDPEMQDNIARPDSFVVHPNERKSWVRYVE